VRVSFVDDKRATVIGEVIGIVMTSNIPSFIILEPSGEFSYKHVYDVKHVPELVREVNRALKVQEDVTCDDTVKTPYGGFGTR
jgi:hypothetical protein